MLVLLEKVGHCYWIVDYKEPPLVCERLPHSPARFVWTWRLPCAFDNQQQARMSARSVDLVLTADNLYGSSAELSTTIQLSFARHNNAPRIFIRTYFNGRGVWTVNFFYYVWHHYDLTYVIDFLRRWFTSKYRLENSESDAPSFYTCYILFSSIQEQGSTRLYQRERVLYLDEIRLKFCKALFASDCLINSLMNS